MLGRNGVDLVPHLLSHQEEQPGKAGPDLNGGRILVKAAAAGGSQPASLLAALSHEGV